MDGWMERGEGRERGREGPVGLALICDILTKLFFGDDTRHVYLQVGMGGWVDGWIHRQASTRLVVCLSLLSPLWL